MRISSRRLKWGIICGLAVTCALILRPVRTLLDQWVLAPMLDPNMSVSELHLHAGKGLMELRGLGWHSQIGEQQLALSAQRAWIAIDPEPLLDKRLRIPKLIMEDTRLQLTDASLASISPFSDSGRMLRSNVWQDTLRERIQSLDWKEVARELTTFLASDDLPRTWQERMQRWLTRSQQLAANAQSFEQATTSLINPLRVESEQQSKLRQLNEILQEQASVTQQFGSLEQLVTATIRRVEERFQDDVKRIDLQLDQQVADAELVSALAREMVNAASARAWGELSAFAEVSDCVARAQWGHAKKKEWNIDVRSIQDPTLAMTDVAATGIFHRADIDFPFQLQGSYERRQQIDYGYQHKARWQAVFDHMQQEIAVIVHTREDNPSINDLQLSTTAMDSASNCRLVVATDLANKSIEGEFTLTPADWVDMLDVATLQSLTVGISGTWDDVKVETLTELPAWLLAATRRKIESELLNSRGELVAQLQLLTETRIAQLQRVADELNKLEEEAVRHSTQIAAVHTTVQQHFSQVNQEANGDVEFARRANGTLR